MPSFDIMYIRDQEIDLIIVPLDSSFGSKSRADQDAAIRELQRRAMSAGLTGTIVPVWDSGDGQMAFVAPPRWHPFLESLSLAYIDANINRVLSW